MHPPLARNRRTVIPLRPPFFRGSALSSVSNELLVILGTTEGSSMGKFFNHYCPDRAVGFCHPYSDRRPETWHYTLGYRGYDLDVIREASLWQVGIHPRTPELPIIHRCEVRSHIQEEAVLEAKRRVDAILTLLEVPVLQGQDLCRHLWARQQGRSHRGGQGRRLRARR